MKDVATDKALEIEEYRGEIGHQRQLSSKLKVRWRQDIIFNGWFIGTRRNTRYDKDSSFSE